MNVCILGALGRMGKAVYLNSKDFNEINVVCGVDAFCENNTMPYPVYKTIDQINEKIDVIIDFSSPAVLDAELEYAIKNNIGLVLCTTGYSDEQIEKIKLASKKIAIFRSANMSIGVNVLINLVKKAATTIPEFDVEIIEKHHNQKVDAPSGTALMFADAIKEVHNEKNYIYGREGKPGKRTKDEIGIHAIRGGNIVGEHEIIFAGFNEIISLKHEALDRSLFANGALRAAIYLMDKSPAIYNMQNLVEEI